jgi:DNA-binding SARP family transcriptional activator
MVEFGVLGSLEVTSGGRSLAVGGARTRAVLALLLTNANSVVSADRLTDELWPDLAPERAAANLQVRLSELRKAFRSAGEADRRYPASWLPVARRARGAGRLPVPSARRRRA